MSRLRIFLLPVLIFLSVFLVYLPGISHSVFGGDSGDIILAAWFGGVAHPPGYPLNTMFGYIFTHLPIGGSVAYRADIMAAFFQALNVGVLFLIVKKLTKNTIISLGASLTIAFNPLFWLYAHTLEVFQLKIFLVLVAQYFLLSWFEVKKKSYLYLSFLFLGLSVFHHTISLLVIPAFAFLIFKKDKNIFSNKKVLYKAVSLFLLGATPYIFAVYAAMRKTPINWDDPSNLTNLIRLATRADFGTFSATDFLVGQTLQMRLVQVLTMFAFLKNDILIIGLILIVIGFVYLFVHKRIIFWFYLILIFLNGPLFLFYSGFPLTNDFIFGIWERFLLETYVYLSIPLAFGVLAIYELVKSMLPSKLFPIGVQIAFLFLPLFLLLSNFEKTNLSKFEIGNKLGRDVFVSASQDSVIFFLNDTMTFNSQYIYYTEKQHLDKKVVLLGSLKNYYYRKQIMDTYPDLVLNDHFRSKQGDISYSYALDLIVENWDKHEFYSTGELGTEKGEWIPSGLLHKLVRVEDKTIYDPKEIFSKYVFDKEYYGYQHFFSNYIVSLYYDSYVYTGNYLSIKSRLEDAENYYERAIDISPDKNTAYINFAISQISNDKCEQAMTNIEKAKNIDDKDIDYLRTSMIFERDCNKDDDSARKIQDLIDSRTNSKKF